MSPAAPPYRATVPLSFAWPDGVHKPDEDEFFAMLRARGALDIGRGDARTLHFPAVSGHSAAAPELPGLFGLRLDMEEAARAVPLAVAVQLRRITEFFRAQGDAA